MINVIRLIVLGILLTVIFFGCNEVDDPLLEGRLPTIRVDFDARESKESTKKLFDSLSARNITLELELDTFRTGDRNPEDSMEFWLENEQIKVVLDSLDPVNSLFQQSHVNLDTFFALGGNFIEEYQDTVNSTFLFPLNINEDTSAFVLQFHSFTDTLTFRYVTEVSAGLERVNVVARNVSATHTSHDVELVRFTCKEENCTSGEITYKIYF